MKKIVAIILFLLGAYASAQNKMILYSLESKVFPRINIPFGSDIYTQKAAIEFQNNFEILTGTRLKIHQVNKFSDNENLIILRVNPDQNKDFCIGKANQNTTITASSLQNLTTLYRLLILNIWERKSAKGT